MADEMLLYLDDSGTRHLDRRHFPSEKPDWFALGGIMVRDRDRPDVEDRHEQFCRRWEIQVPLHSSDIRFKKEGFRWLRDCTELDQKRFLSELGHLVTSPGIIALACVIDRPGYAARYLAKYGRARWEMCKTAFSVVVERAAKFARLSNCKLRVYAERSGKDADRRLQRYYSDLRSTGLPFDERNSARYAPLTQTQLEETLREFKLKRKTSRLMQIADLCLHPMCAGGYDPKHFALGEMRKAGTLINCQLLPDQVEQLGIKYSCWELERQKTAKPDEKILVGL